MLIQELQYSSKPVSKEEFIAMYMEHKKTSIEDTRRFADEVYSTAGESGNVITRYLAHSIINMETDEVTGTLIPNQRNIYKHGPVYVPNSFPVTPFPNLEEYIPNDYYDLRPGPSSPLNNSRVKTEWFDASPSLKNMLATYQYPKKLPFARNAFGYNNALLSESRTSTYRRNHITKYHERVDENGNSLGPRKKTRAEMGDSSEPIAEPKIKPKFRKGAKTSNLTEEEVVSN